MTKVLIFAVEVEDDQDTPDVGDYFDATNDDWTWIDTRFAGAIDADEDRLPAIVKNVL